MSVRVLSLFRSLYSVAVEAVKPNNLIQSCVKLNGNVLQFQDTYELEIKKNCIVVGFGKAVLGMAIQLEEILGDHICKGVLSIPHGIIESLQLSEKFSHKFKIFEGALNNTPDLNALKATQEIQSLITTLKEEDILIVLISGGGSALLVSPVDSLKLEEKQLTVQLLSRSGATINELNVVRKRLSALKGGKLAQLCNPTKTVSLILSDVIGNPLDIIASGPTVCNRDPDGEALSVISKYGLIDKVPPIVLDITSSHRAQRSEENPKDYSHVHNILIGSNLTALSAAQKYAAGHGYATLILGDQIQGDATEIGKNFASLAKLLVQMLSSDAPQHSFINDLSVILENVHVDPSLCCQLERLVRKCSTNRQNLCLIGGGETTVKVIGTGLGGRNQQMALSFLSNHPRASSASEIEVVFMSAGTDGADGPTDAAGAMSCSSAYEQACQQALDPNVFLRNNDSYNFFRLLSDGAYHLRVGPTGTNVMDIHVICLIWQSS